MLEAVTNASWLVQAITEPLCNQSVVETYGCWGNEPWYAAIQLLTSVSEICDTYIRCITAYGAKCLCLTCVLLEITKIVSFCTHATAVTYYINDYLCISTYPRI